jgi:hypothetical protein
MKMTLLPVSALSKHFNFIFINSRKMTWVGHAAYTGEMKSATELQPRKPWGKSPFGRARNNRQGDKIRMNCRETVHVDTY